MAEMTSRPAEIRTALQLAARLDREWMGRVPGTDHRYTPWMPYSIPEFLMMALEALPEADGDTFLDIGAGVGTKMLLAREILGLDVHGIERVPEYAAQARQLGLDVEEADAAGWKGYGDYSLIWFNRPFRDRDAQAGLEARVWEEAAPGAVVICANLENPPPSSWFVTLDDWEVRRGVWVKPPQG